QGCSTTTDNRSNFLKAIHIYGEQDENNNSASHETEDEISDVMCDADDEDVDGVEVDFVEVTLVLDEDDGLQFQLPKHHRCACHLLNLVSTVDAAEACSNEAYKKLSRSAFAKRHALWNKCDRSVAAAEIIEEEVAFGCSLFGVATADRLVRTTTWHRFYAGCPSCRNPPIFSRLGTGTGSSGWGLDYIKDHLEEETFNQTPVDGSSASEEEDFFASMKPTHRQEGIKQLDGYIACKADDKEILKSFPAV
ncbi:hypothetical protein QTP70_025515, partial [Hemibagrus guttatus]